MNYIIITGASRGLGEALCRKFIQPNNHIFCIARRANERLIELAEKNNVALDYYEFDLTESLKIPELMQKIAGKIDPSIATSITLINNAGTVAPITTIDRCQADQIAYNITLNLLSPMILTSEFIKLFGKWETEKKIVNLSSGAGKKPYYGWSSYCTSKSGLDLFTRCVGLEQDTLGHSVKIISVAPGVIDTDMQKEIRSKSPEDFIQVERFIEMEKEGRLLSSDYVAEKISNLLHDKALENGAVVDIRDYYNL